MKKQYTFTLAATIAVLSLCASATAGASGDGNDMGVSENSGYHETDTMDGESSSKQRASNASMRTPNYNCNALGQSSNCITILLDHMQRIKIEKPVSVVVIGNPSIADVTLLDSQIAFVSAKSIGTTNLVALNEKGDEIANYQVLVKEPQTKRVSIRRAFNKENYQCAPECNRALSMTDTSEAFNDTSSVVSSRIEMNEQIQDNETDVIQGLSLQANADE